MTSPAHQPSPTGGDANRPSSIGASGALADFNRDAREASTTLEQLAVIGGAKDIATAEQIALQMSGITEAARATIKAFQSETKSAINFSVRAYGASDAIPAEICEFCARLYNDYQYTGPDGLVNPFDTRYHEGGVHFSRTPEWFAKQMQLNGAHLVVGTVGNGHPVCYSLFFTDPKAFPGFADDTQRYRLVPGIENHLAYTYLFIVDKNFVGLGLGADIVQESMRIAADNGCRVLAHEYFRAPTPSTASTIAHEVTFRNRFGAVSITASGSHEIKNATGGTPALVRYAHMLIPTTPQTVLAFDGSGLQVTHDGTPFPKLDRQTLEMPSDDLKDRIAALP